MALRISIVAGVWLLVTAVTLGLAGRWQASGRPVATRDAKVVVFGIPHLGFSDLGPHTTPVLWRLMHTRAAIAATTVRSQDTRPNTLEGYATLGAGSRLAAPKSAGLAVAADAPDGSSTAGQALAIRTGIAPDGTIVVPAGVPVLRANIGRHIASTPGALGTALRRAGRETGVVSNADVPNLATARWRQSRPAALALMDRTLALSTGQVDRRLLVQRTPRGGAHADPAAMVRATSAALRDADAVVVDPGDMDRAAAFAQQALPGPAAASRSAALLRTDALLGAMLKRLPAKTLVLVVSVSPPPDAGLTPTLALGPGVVRGTLSSSSTKRDGLVAVTDLAPTILSALHVPKPAGMVGHPLNVTPGHPGLARFRAMDASSATQTSAYRPAIIGAIVFEAMVFALMILCTWTHRRLRPAGWRLAALTIVTFPLATYLVAVVPGATRASAPVASAGLAGLAVGTAALCLWAGARRHPLAALAWALALTITVPVIDVIIGGPLHRSTLLGFSLVGGGRFYGWPNSTFAVVGSAALLLCAVLVTQLGRRADLLVGCACGLGYIVLVDGSPSLGTDVGGILALVPIYVLFMVALVGRRLTPRAWVLAALATVAVLAVAVGFDLLAPFGARTDIGDFFSGLFHDGGHGARTTIARKVSVNVGLIGHTVWTWMLPVFLVFGAWALSSARRRRRLVPSGSALRAGVVATCALAILGFAVNDSGPLVIALALSFIGPLFVILLSDGDTTTFADGPRRATRSGIHRRRDGRPWVDAPRADRRRGQR